jgi:hypothetical protein
MRFLGKKTGGNLPQNTYSTVSTNGIRFAPSGLVYLFALGDSLSTNILGKYKKGFRDRFRKKILPKMYKFSYISLKKYFLTNLTAGNQYDIIEGFALHKNIP